MIGAWVGCLEFACGDCLAVAASVLNVGWTNPALVLSALAVGLPCLSVLGLSALLDLTVAASEEKVGWTKLPPVVGLPNLSVPPGLREAILNDRREGCLEGLVLCLWGYMSVIVRGLERMMECLEWLGSVKEVNIVYICTMLNLSLNYTAFHPVSATLMEVVHRSSTAEYNID